MSTPDLNVLLCLGNSVFWGLVGSGAIFHCRNGHSASFLLFWALAHPCSTVRHSAQPQMVEQRNLAAESCWWQFQDGSNIIFQGHGDRSTRTASRPPAVLVKAVHLTIKDGSNHATTVDSWSGLWSQLPRLPSFLTCWLVSELCGVLSINFISALTRFNFYCGKLHSIKVTQVYLLNIIKTVPCL